MKDIIKVTEVAWGAKGTRSSVIAATLLRLLFCWASRVLGCSVGLLFACLSPESAQPSSRHPSSSVVSIGRGPKAYDTMWTVDSGINGK